MKPHELTNFEHACLREDIIKLEEQINQIRDSICGSTPSTIIDHEVTMTMEIATIRNEIRNAILRMHNE